MKTVNLGKTEAGEDINLDFDQENIRFVLLIGRTGSGKSIFHNHLYSELMARYTPEEVGFIFMDMTRVDFVQWDSKYLARPVIVDAGEALDVLENLRDEKRKIIVHIEECDMVHRDRAQFERGINNVLHNNKNIILVYSTSAMNFDYLTDWMENFVDLRVVFQVRDKETSRLLLGNDAAAMFTVPGERILAYHDKQVKCVPFPKPKKKLYLDIDEVLLTRKGEQALGLVEFLKFATENFDCYWLTTHCDGDTKDVFLYLIGKVSAEAIPFIEKIKPTKFGVFKTEAIDFENDFFWLDDTLFEGEKAMLVKCDVLESFIRIDLASNPNQLSEVMKKLHTELRI